MKVVFTLEPIAHTTLGCIKVVCLYVMLRPPNSQGSMTKGVQWDTFIMCSLEVGVIEYWIKFSRKFNKITWALVLLFNLWVKN